MIVCCTFAQSCPVCLLFSSLEHFISVLHFAAVYSPFKLFHKSRVTFAEGYNGQWQCQYEAVLDALYWFVASMCL